MNIRRSFLAMGLVAAMACLPLFGTAGAILSPMAGTVAVNGQPVVAGSAVVAGDLVSTNAAGSARMVLAGASVTAASNTNFRLVSVNSASQIRLNSGLVKVAGNLPVALSTHTVVPTSAKSAFNVYNLSGKIYVEAVAGTVEVKSASSTYTVHAGEAVTFADQTAQAPAAATTGTGASTLSVPVAIGMAGAAAVATGTIVHEATKSSNSASPSQL